MAQKYITTIGLEVHVQLKTRSKMFCACPVEFGAGPNTHTCPVCLGMPGALPVMNGEALKKSALAGRLLECAIPDICKFDRKNYFYPDMPKNYQITQYDQPICIGGEVPLPFFAYPKDMQKNLDGPIKTVKLTRIHLEEDVAKSTHFEASSGIDFNRAGTPLMEIVSEPEIDSPEEAFAYLSALQYILILSDVSDADMEKGQFRCDCNISVRPEGQAEYGTKIEIKNMNSISAVRRALAYEIERQTTALENGEKLIQSTRGWNDTTGQTFHMRSKESAHDYRYFPDPDLLPVNTAFFIDEVNERYETAKSRIQASAILPEYYNAVLGAAVRNKQSWSSIDEYDDLSNYYKTLVLINPKGPGWMINSLLPALTTSGIRIRDSLVSAENLGELVKLIDDGKINNMQAKDVFNEMFKTGGNAIEIVKDWGLEQVSDTGAIEAMCNQAIEASPKAVAEYKAGKTQAINSIKGQVMKLSKGKANPAVVDQILAKKLAG